MQALTRPSRSKQRRPATSLGITTGIPAPFPRGEFLRTQEAHAEVPARQAEPQAGPSFVPESEKNIQETTKTSLLHDLTPSIGHVRKSCIMTLNNLLSAPIHWSPIVPDRRHSMPSAVGTSRLDADSSSALQTLVTNLRNRTGNEDMIEVQPTNTDIELINELRTHVENISPTLDPEDAILASSLVSLLSHFDHLSNMQLTSSHTSTQSQELTSWDSAGLSDVLSSLRQQLTDLQLGRLTLQPEILAPGAPPVLAVEAMLLWHRIDEELENVVALCKERTGDMSRRSQDHLPPQYDFEAYEADMPPKYDEAGGRTSIDSLKSPSTHQHITRPADEKMRLDLENVAMAIDRLYLVAPQLHNQRVELKSSKVAQLEKASREGKQAAPSRGKQKERDVRELENIVELLAKASERSLNDQSVVLEGGLKGMSDKARLKDEARKAAFVDQLATHSNAGRLHNQDAVLSSKTKDPHTMLTLPEFIREPLPAGSRARLRDPNALLTLPEFVKEHPIFDDSHPELPGIGKPTKKHRLRSSSAPSLTWLLSSKTGPTSSSLAPSRSRSRLNPSSPPVPGMGFQVTYIAENHENLHHVLVFFAVTGATPGVDLEAEVVPLPYGSNGAGSDRLIITSGPRTSLPLTLPAHVLPGKHVVRVQGDHFEVKMATTNSLSPRTAGEDLPPLLDAAQLSAANPTSFICASCSLPLVQSTRIREYRDLPSEHWAELVEAWMCHSDQKLHDQVMKHGQMGFWPEPRQGLVGGSYILFEESSVTTNNLHMTEENKHGEDWRLARCLCGAVIGRYQDHPIQNVSTKRRVFRLLKFAIRPVSPTLLKIPLSAFIVGDMTELVQAHATYRFVISDEEEEIPRILIWLFKPSIRIAYTTATAYSIPKRASIHAAKVLYRVLTPTERLTDLKTTLQRYPGFPQAEHLFYPMPICLRLANLLGESNTAYPDSLREMTGLQVGWLHRA